MARKQHKSARGEFVNFDELTIKYKDVVAIGNAKMNAAGDILGPGGRVIQEASDREATQLQKIYRQRSTERTKKEVKYISVKDNIDNLEQANTARLMDTFTEEELTGKGAKTPAEVVKELTEKNQKVVAEVKAESKSKEKTKSTRKIVDSDE